MFQISSLGGIVEPKVTDVERLKKQVRKLAAGCASLRAMAR
jgi:hypothetical protein